MKREWKPGTVAMVTALNRHTPYRAYFDGEVWVECDSKFSKLRTPTSIHPFAQIDPEDREAVERLRDLYDVAVVRQNDDPDPRDVTPGMRGNALQAALRDLADPKPPKPKEPTGLGAVVEDEDGERWVWMAAGADGAHWLRVGMPRGSVWRTWHLIDAVRVLSEGVTR